MSGDTEVGDGFQGGVQENVKWVYFGPLKTTVFRTLCSRPSSRMTDVCFGQNRSTDLCLHRLLAKATEI